MSGEINQSWSQCRSSEAELETEMLVCVVYWKTALGRREGSGWAGQELGQDVVPPGDLLPTRSHSWSPGATLREACCQQVSCLSTCLGQAPSEGRSPRGTLVF